MLYALPRKYTDASFYRLYQSVLDLGHPNARFLMTTLLLFSEPGNISVIVVVDADKLVPSFYSVLK